MLGYVRGKYSTVPIPGADVTLNQSTVDSAGGNQPHNNMQPYTTLNYIICINGIYPPRD